VRLLVLGAGYIGARAGQLALADGNEVVLADNWYATERSQLASVEAAGAHVETADIRRPEDVERLLALGCDRVLLLAAQASRPASEREPEYTEATNATGVRVVAQALAARGGPATVFASSLRVYGDELGGEVTAEHAYGRRAISSI